MDTKIVNSDSPVRGGGGGGHLNANKHKQRKEGVLACVHVHFFEKNAEIFKMKFYSYSPVFPIVRNDD